ncbi:MAG: leucine-rich repeat domain-containing protein [Oscillospiraceae bacterium]|nr:leucine-rich repeat domain-containing protein [Oscillospiraceae bacterium]
MVNVAGFENTIAVSQKLKGMVQQFGDDILNNSDKFVSLMNDFIPEYEKERRLLKNVVKSDVLTKMRRSDNQNIAEMKAKEYMMNEMFLSEGAVEFVMVCFTYLLDWNYETTMPEQGAVAAPAQAFQPQPQYTAAPNPYGGAPMAGFAPPPMQQPIPQPVIPQAAAAPQIQAAAAAAASSAPASAQPEENPVVFAASDAARSRLRGNVKVPGGYTTLDNFCFDGFSFMKTIELPATLITIGDYAFSECKRLKAITIPPSVRIIRQGAFSSCGKLTRINVPSGVTEIADNTFEFCHNLEIVELPNTLLSIGNGAFQGCESLRKLFIPESVKQIADDAFKQCAYLTVKCYDKSYAYKFCSENGIKTEIISKGGLF